MTDPRVKIDSLWKPSSPVTLAEYHPGIAYEARRLLREAMVNSVKLRPPDAIHLATARVVGAPTFHTYDEQLAKFAGLTQLTIRKPQLDQAELF